MLTDIIVIIGTFVGGFWAGKTYQTKEALRDAVKAWFNKL